MKPGENLKALRTAAGMTQAELARAIRSTVPTVRAYESGKKDILPADMAMAARIFNRVEARDLLDPDLMCRLAVPNQALFDETRLFVSTCGLDEGHAVAAIETERVSNDPDPAHPDGTRWVPGTSGKAGAAEWRKERMRVRFLAGFEAIYPKESRPATLGQCLADPGFRQAVTEAAALQDVSEWDREESALLLVLARLYVAYDKACIDPARTTCTQAEQAINAAMLARP